MTPRNEYEQPKRPLDLAGIAEFNAGVRFSALAYENDQYARCSKGHERRKGAVCLPCNAAKSRRHRERKAS